MNYLTYLITQAIPKIPKLLYWKAIDAYRYIKYKKWRKFDMYGLYIFTGMFGQGKTYSMVHKAYNIAKRYPHVKILTNMKLQGFPEHTEIIPLTNYQQIIDIEGDTLILLDEISSIFNSRNWSKQGIPPTLLGLLLQVRKEKKVIFGTAQRFLHVDKLIRDITYSVIECRTSFGRWTYNCYFDGFEYERYYDNPEKVPTVYNRRLYIQTDKMRKRYDTFEMIDKAKKTKFLSDEEILERQGSSTVLNMSGKKKKSVFSKIMSK